MKCSPGEKLISVNKDVAPGCPCPHPKCIKVAAATRTAAPNGCTIKGKFVAFPKCSRCSCNGDSFGCVPLCTLSTRKCSPGEMLISVNKDVAPGCPCPHPKCVKAPNGCTIKGKFVAFPKCSRCSCNGDSIGCVPLCTLSTMKCSPGEKLISVNKDVAPGCPCPHPKCVKEPAAPTACKDNHKNCAFWARDGECKKNPKYMLPNCGLSCGHCSNKVTGGTCKSVSKGVCRKIATKRGRSRMKVYKKGSGPAGCYVITGKGYMVYNDAASKAKCSKERMCFCQKAMLPSGPW